MTYKYTAWAKISEGNISFAYLLHKSNLPISTFFYEYSSVIDASTIIFY